MLWFNENGPLRRVIRSCKEVSDEDSDETGLHSRVQTGSGSRLVTHQGYGVSEAAHNLGINTNMLGRWKRQAEARENGARADNGRLSREQEELERLRKENKRLRWTPH